MTVHRCKPSLPCALCRRDVHLIPRGRTVSPTRVPLALVTCSSLDPTPVRIPGSPRVWNRCTGGYGSTTADERAGLVCGCSTPSPGVWRNGVECGAKCPGYHTTAATLAAPPAYGPIPHPIPAPFPLPPYGWTPQYGAGGSPAPPAPPAPSTDLPRWHPVAPPSITPTRPRLVVTLVVGDDAEHLHAATGPPHRRYAERMGADYVVIRGRTQDPRMPCAEKWRVGQYVPHYPGGTLYLDADVWVHPESPDVFELVPSDAIGLRDISTQSNLLAWAWSKYREVCESQGVRPHPVAMTHYWNSGVWVGRPEHAGYWTPPSRPYPAEHCTEEHWCRHNLAASGWPVFDIGEQFNWLWYQDRQAERANGSHFLHLAGMSQKVKTWEQGNAAWRLTLLRLLASMG